MFNIQVKDLKNILKEDILIIIDLGPNNYNIAQLTPYSKKYDYCFIENFILIDKKVILIQIL